MKAQVVFGDQSSFHCTSDSEIDMYRSLMSSLIPISSYRTGTLDHHDVEMFVLENKDPCLILVKVHSDNQLEYQWGKFVYTGGDSKMFVAVIDRMRAINSSQPVE